MRKWGESMGKMIKVYTLADFSGSKIPVAVFDGGTILSMRTRFKSGTRRFAITKLESNGNARAEKES